MLDKNENEMRALALKLYEINAFKFGDFKMKVGINSPVYFDLRVIVSFPEVMEQVSNLISNYVRENKLQCKHVCGVPYTALPIATVVSIRENIPMLVRRKEAKSYGTKKLIEGKFSAGDTCLIVEDVVTSGSSVLDTVFDLQKEGIVVSDAVVVVDREQGGFANIGKHSVRMHSLFTLSYLLNVLKEAGKIQQETVDSVAKYISGCQINSDGSFVDGSKKVVNEFARTKMTFESRSNLAKCEVAKKLFQLMATKKTTLCLAADMTDCEKILNAADLCGPYICVLKTHIDIVENFSEDFIKNLVALSKKHNFLIMEDRKFADIGNTVSMQYSKGLFKIAQWADLVTAHSISGQGILQGLKAGLVDAPKNRGVFLLGEMSSSGNLINDQYKEATAKLATNNEDVDFVAGIVCQSADCFAFPGLIQLTPGVKIDQSGDDLGQQYKSPEFIVQEKGADVAVVGRGILEAKCMEKAASLYRDRLWAAYCDRIA